MRNVSINFVKKNKTHILSTNYFDKVCLINDVKITVEVDKQTNENIIWSFRFAFWITKSTNTHSDYSHLLVRYSNNGYVKSTQC